MNSRTATLSRPAPSHSDNEKGCLGTPGDGHPCNLIGLWNEVVHAFPGALGECRGFILWIELIIFSCILLQVHFNLQRQYFLALAFFRRWVDIYLSSRESL
jgi:hypothetical protein